MLMAVTSAIFDVARLQRRLLAIPGVLITSGLALTVLHYRLPMNADAPVQTNYGEKVFESERLESGRLANQVRPKDHPVLWTGHGYPAYMFDGFVADYSGLNTRAIWAAQKDVIDNVPAAREFLSELGLEGAPQQYKAEMYLIRMYDANVFMLHGFFPEKVQKALSLRLVGSFYTIDMVNAPAFRVFVKDAANAHVVRLAPKSGVLAEGGAVVHGELYDGGEAVSFPVPRRSDRLFFGVAAIAEEQDVTVADDQGGVIGRCVISQLAAGVREGVRACDIALSPDSLPQRLTLRATHGRLIKVFEPAFQSANS